MTRREAEEKILDEMIKIKEIYREYAGNTDCLVLHIRDGGISFWNDGFKNEETPPIDFIFNEIKIERKDEG